MKTIGWLASLALLALIKSPRAAECIPGITRISSPSSASAKTFAPTTFTTILLGRQSCDKPQETRVGMFYLNQQGRVVGLILEGEKFRQPTPQDQLSYTEMAANADDRDAKVKIALAEDARRASESAAARAAIAATETSGPCDGPDIRLDESGLSMMRVPVLDQSDIGICYAYAGASAFDAFRYSHGDIRFNRRSSQIEAAIGVSQDAKKIDPSEVVGTHKRDLFFEGGSPKKVFSYLLDQGSCERTWIPDRTNELSPKDFLQKIQRYFTATKEFEATKPTDFEPRVRTTSRQLNQWLIQSGFNSTAAVKDDVLAEALKQQSERNFLQSVFSGSCPNDSRYRASLGAKVSELWTYKIDKKNDPTGYFSVRKYVNEKLSAANAQPIMLGYCSAILGAHGGRGYRASKHGNCGLHASLIIGQRFNQKMNKCQVLIHNSYGSSKNNSHPDWENEGGKIWVDLASLVDNITDFSVAEVADRVPASPLEKKLRAGFGKIARQIGGVISPQRGQSYEYSIDGKKLELVELADKKLLLSASCFHRIPFPHIRCSANWAYLRAGWKSTRLLLKDLSLDGRNPGATLCSDFFKGQLVTGEDPNGGETTFCKFKDSSLIDNGSLTYQFEKTLL